MHTPTPCYGHISQCTTTGAADPTTRALDQLVKGCRMAMHNAAKMAAQNKELLAANEKQMRKRERMPFIGPECALTVKEGMGRVRRLNEGQGRSRTGGRAA
ncbi:hypothetical protein VTO42DRAFT_5181 [Malbranchea cinnamomea]